MTNTWEEWTRGSLVARFGETEARSMINTLSDEDVDIIARLCDPEVARERETRHRKRVCQVAREISMGLCPNLQAGRPFWWDDDDR